jgi:hypothetical protein
MISVILTVQALAVYVLDKFQVHGLRTVSNFLDLDLFAKIQQKWLLFWLFRVFEW